MSSRITPSNPFVRFDAQEIEQSIPRRFEKIAAAEPSVVVVLNALPGKDEAP